MEPWQPEGGIPVHLAAAPQHWLEVVQKHAPEFLASGLFRTLPSASEEAQETPPIAGEAAIAPRSTNESVAQSEVTSLPDSASAQRKRRAMPNSSSCRRAWWLPRPKDPAPTAVGAAEDTIPPGDPLELGPKRQVVSRPELLESDTTIVCRSYGEEVAAGLPSAAGAAADARFSDSVRRSSVKSVNDDKDPGKQSEVPSGEVALTQRVSLDWPKSARSPAAEEEAHNLPRRVADVATSQGGPSKPFDLSPMRTGSIRGVDFAAVDSAPMIVRERSIPSDGAHVATPIQSAKGRAPNACVHDALRRALGKGLSGHDSINDGFSSPPAKAVVAAQGTIGQLESTGWSSRTGESEHVWHPVALEMTGAQAELNKLSDRWPKLPELTLGYDRRPIAQVIAHERRRRERELRLAAEQRGESWSA